jgi:hypothetical protein
MQDTNTEVAREAFAAFAARDLERLGQLLDEDITWHTPGNSLLAGDYHGRAAVTSYLNRALELTSDTQRVEPVDLLVGSGHVAALVDISGERRGLTLSDRAIQLLAFRNGRIVMRRVYRQTRQPSTDSGLPDLSFTSTRSSAM